jgi:hypothetical protein
MLRVPTASTSSSLPFLICGSRASPGDGSASVLGVVEFALFLAGGGVLDGVSPELAAVLGVSSFGLPKLGRLGFEGAAVVSDAEVLAGALAAGAFAGVLAGASLGLPKLGRLGSAGALG